MIGLATLPETRIELDGAPLDPSLHAALDRIRVEQVLSKPARCVLSFVLPDDHSAALSPRIGADVRVALVGRDTRLFGGEVTAIEYALDPSGGHRLVLRAADALHRLDKRGDVRGHVGVDLAGLARALASDAGLRVDAPGGGPRWETLLQSGESDLDLLVRTAMQCGRYCTVRERTLHLIDFAGFGPTVPLTLGETLLEYRVEVNADRACRSVVVRGWDPRVAEDRAGTASSARVGRAVDAAAPPSAADADGRVVLVNRIVQSDDQAEAAAQSLLDARAGEEVWLWGVAEGDPDLCPGAPIRTHGLPSGIDGRYVVGAVTHRIDPDHGYVSEIDTRPPAPAPPPSAPPAGAATMTLGVVTRVNDPEGLGRVRVELPTFGEVETDWLEVVLPAAGRDKGLVALPNVDDRVAVLLDGANPACGLVIGGLYAKGHAAETGVSGNAVKGLALMSASGHALTLDDGKHTVRLEDGAGNFLELSRGKTLLHSAGKLVLEAPGKTVEIRGARIDLKSG